MENKRFNNNNYNSNILMDVISCVLQRTVPRPLLFILNTTDMFSFLKSLLVGNAANFTSIRRVEWPRNGEADTLYVRRDLVRIDQWCLVWGMKPNPSNTKTMVVSRSRIVTPCLPVHTTNDGVLVEHNNMNNIEVKLDKR